MPGPFCLRHIVVSFNVTAQLFPIQLVGAVGAGTPVRHTARPEPAVDAGLTHLEPPSRFCLAPPTPYKIHHPLSQIY